MTCPCVHVSEADDALAAADSPAGPAWLQFGRWLAWHRDQHPDDDRSDLDLIDPYAAWCEARWPSP